MIKVELRQIIEYLEAEGRAYRPPVRIYQLNRRQRIEFKKAEKQRRKRSNSGVEEPFTPKITKQPSEYNFKMKNKTLVATHEVDIELKIPSESKVSFFVNFSDM